MKKERKPGVWRGEPPASEAAIQKLLAESRLNLPAAYLDQLRLSNGGEGDLDLDPYWVVFWTAETVVEWNNDYEVPEYLPGYFAFASNGGPELLAFKVNDSGSWPIYMIPFVPMEEEYANMIAEDFEAFREAIGYENTDDE